MGLEIESRVPSLSYSRHDMTVLRQENNYTSLIAMDARTVQGPGDRTPKHWSENTAFQWIHTQQLQIQDNNNNRPCTAPTSIVYLEDVGADLFDQLCDIPAVLILVLSKVGIITILSDSPIVCHLRRVI